MPGFYLTKCPCGDPVISSPQVQRQPLFSINAGLFTSFDFAVAAVGERRAVE
jgi:hypothetical protein